MRAAYGAASDAWANGPERVYAALAAALVARSPVPLAGRTVLDVGTGTGVAARVLAARGARPVGVDLAPEMLRHGGARRPPGVAGDAAALPVADAAVGGAVYAFCLNHLADPERALREAARVVAPGGVVLGSVFATGGEPPEKSHLEAVLLAFGWTRPEWYDAMKRGSEPLLATPERFAACAARAGLAGVRAVATEVAVGPLRASDVVAWRLGMPHTAPFVGSLPPERRLALRLAAQRAVAGQPREVRPRVVLLAARVR
jgi:SAM-dependent methyltransferase